MQQFLVQQVPTVDVLRMNSKPFSHNRNSDQGVQQFGGTCWYGVNATSATIFAFCSLLEERPPLLSPVLDVRELSLLQRREECSLLTSPFIEPGL